MSTTVTPSTSTIQALLDELLLIRSSLLPTESLTLSSSSSENIDWESLLDAHSSGSSHGLPKDVTGAPELVVSVDKCPVALRVTPSFLYPRERKFDVEPTGGIGREEAELWRARIRDARGAVEEDAQYPIYELISLALLPALQEYVSSTTSKQTPTSSSTTNPAATAMKERRSKPYHALFTSHHLIAPSKRRSLHAWSSELHLSGFAKLGYPGVIYVQGEEEVVIEFVRRVKALNWLALRLRVSEPILVSSAGDGVKSGVKEERSSWCEYEKIGEVVEAMRAFGREGLIWDAGIGASGGS